MPFVKKHDAQDPQPRIDPRNSFIGRTDELHFFRQNILTPEDPTYNILSISGQGGVGKSTLLARFIDEAHSPTFKDYCLMAIVDERQTTPVSIMEGFAGQLRLKGKFEKALRQYKETLRRLLGLQSALQDSNLENIPDFVGAAVEIVPFAGSLLREGVKAGTKHLVGRYHADQVRRDAELLVDPLAVLTTAFVEELNRLVDTYVTLHSRREQRQRRVLLFFDTFEQLAMSAVPWLLDYFLPDPISSNVVLVIAGRDSLDQSLPDDPKGWLPYYDRGDVYSMPLKSFTEDETRVYLAGRGITDPARIAAIWQLSRGLPLYLGLLTANPSGEVDPTEDVVVNFLRWIPEQEVLKRKLALDAALFSTPFNQDDLAAFPSVSEQERSPLFRWLTRQPFVHRQDGRYLYHDVVQELFSRHLFQRSKSEYYASRRALAEYYQQSLKELQQKGGEEGDDSHERLEFVLALANQLFFLQDEASHLQAIEQLLYAMHNYSEQEGEIVRVLRDISPERPTSLASTGARQTVTQLLHYLETDWGSRESLTQAITILDRWIKLTPKSLAFYSQRGWTYFLLQEYQRALADFNRALELNADADFDHALELDPKEGGAYNGRGSIYMRLKEYQRALSDFDRFIEVGPTNYWAYSQRGLTYLWLKEIRQARADFTKSWELDLTIVWNGWMIECTRMCQERPDSGMVERLDAIAARDPKDPWAHVCRGVAQWLRGRFEEALVEIEQAIVLEPPAAAYFWKGMACVSLEREEEAMKAIKKALDEGMLPILLTPLRWFEQERPDFYEEQVVPLLAKHV